MFFFEKKNQKTFALWLAAKERGIWTAGGAAVFAAFALLYAFTPVVYHRVMDLWSFNAWPTPFFDSLFYITNRDCFLHGVNVYQANPCDPLNRVFSNSPILLRLPLIPWREAANPWFGFSWVCCFLASLAVLPPIAGWRRKLLFAAMLISPVTVFAVERANLDLLMFTLASVFVPLIERGRRARLLAYGLAMLGFLAKFYPVVLMLHALRERPRVLALLAAGATCVVLGYAALFHHELHDMARNVPRPGPFGDGIGASQLVDGIYSAAKRHGVHLGPFRWLAPIVQYLGFAWAALRLAGSPALITALARLTRRETTALLTGAVLMTGCFFAGRSISYRAIFLLLTLPGLMVIAAPPWRGRAGLALRAAPFLATALCWHLPANRALGLLRDTAVGLDGAQAAQFALWLGREAAWWWVMTLFAAVLLRALVAGVVDGMLPLRLRHCAAEPSG